MFTEDSRRVNEIFERRVEYRLASGQNLFENVSFDYTFDPYEKILYNAEVFALFSNPTNFSNINTAAEEEVLSYWILAAFVAAAVGISLIAALKSAKKGEN